MITEDRRQRKKAKTKELIYNVALELFLTKGYDRTTIEEITEKADVAKGTFFNHFSSKAAILFYLGEKRNALLEQILIKELKNTQSAKEKLTEYFRILAEFNEAEKDITSLIVTEIFKNTVLTEIGNDESVKKFQAVIKEIVEEGKLQGEFRVDIDTTYIADILVGIYFFTVISWLEGGLGPSLVDELLARVKVLMLGVGTSCGVGC